MTAPARTSLQQPAWDLAYLFAAHFDDDLGPILQTPADDSILEPGVRSAYFDVLRAIESDRTLISFALYSDERGVVYAVDLRDGHFEFKIVLPGGGIVTWPFSAQPVSSPISSGKPSLPPGGSFRLVYMRDHQQDILSFVQGDNGDRRDTLGEHRIAYRFGWEYDVLVDGAIRTFAQTIVIV